MKIDKLKQILKNVQELLLYNRGAGSTTILSQAAKSSTRSIVTLNGDASEFRERYPSSSNVKSFSLKSLERDGSMYGIPRSAVIIDPSFLMRLNEAVFDVILEQERRIAELEQDNFDIYQKAASCGIEVKLSNKPMDPLSPVKGLLTSRDGAFELFSNDEHNTNADKSISERMSESRSDYRNDTNAQAERILELEQENDRLRSQLSVKFA